MRFLKVMFEADDLLPLGDNLPLISLDFLLYFLRLLHVFNDVWRLMLDADLEIVDRSAGLRVLRRKLYDTGFGLLE